MCSDGRDCKRCDGATHFKYGGTNRGVMLCGAGQVSERLKIAQSDTKKARENGHLLQDPQEEHCSGEDQHVRRSRSSAVEAKLHDADPKGIGPSLPVRDWIRSSDSEGPELEGDGFQTLSVQRARPCVACCAWGVYRIASNCQQGGNEEGEQHTLFWCVPTLLHALQGRPPFVCITLVP